MVLLKSYPSKAHSVETAQVQSQTTGLVGCVESRPTYGYKFHLSTVSTAPTIITNP